MASNLNDVFDDVKGEQSFYTPGAKKPKKEYIPIVKGEYLGHITDVEAVIRDVKRKDGSVYKGRVYNYTVKVAPENKSNTYKYQEINGDTANTDGGVYEGYRFKGKVWRFLEPQKGDTFSSNNEGNKGYVYFCAAIGVECPTEKKDIDGKKVEVKTLPHLNSADIIGKAVTAVVDYGRTYKDKNGNERTFMDCKFIKQWEDGKDKKEESGNDIPF